jgi:hypothetical protein
MKAKRFLSVRVLPMVALLLNACADGGGGKVVVVPGAWTFGGFREDRDLSGVAAWDEKHVLVVTDETVTVQGGIMDRAARTVTAGVEIPLPVPVTGEKVEADAEGVAVLREDGAYYVTGSHGLSTGFRWMRRLGSPVLRGSRWRVCCRGWRSIPIWRRM